MGNRVQGKPSSPVLKSACRFGRSPLLGGSGGAIWQAQPEDAMQAQVKFELCRWRSAAGSCCSCSRLAQRVGAGTATLGLGALAHVGLVVAGREGHGGGSKALPQLAVGEGDRRRSGQQQPRGEQRHHHRVANTAVAPVASWLQL